MILNLESSGFSFTLDPKDSPATVGREEPANIVVESSSVSRKHCELICEEGDWFVKDLGSRYGTTVNGKAATKPLQLGNGDVLKLGSQNFIISLLKSNDMEDLGRHLSGGKVRGIIAQATQKRPEAPKVPPARKKKIEPSRALSVTEEEDAKPADDASKAADAPAETAAAEDSAESAAEDAAEPEAEGETEAKPAKGIKAGKKGSLRGRGAPVKKKSSPLAVALKLVVAVAVLGAGGYFGWQYYQQQQQQAAGTPSGSGESVKLPPKPGTVALPAKDEDKQEPAPAPKSDEKPEAKPEEKPASTEPKPDEKAEPKKDNDK